MPPSAPAAGQPVLELILRNYKNFNARATRDALLAYWKHVQGGGKMFWAVAGAIVMPSWADDMAPATAQNMRPPCSTWRQYASVASRVALALKFL